MTVHNIVPALPEPTVLLDRCRGFAILDAILEPPDAMIRVHTFDPVWSRRDRAALATMDPGTGDVLRFVFDPAGVFIYGFDHESDASTWKPRRPSTAATHWPGLLDGVPASLAKYTRHRAFLWQGTFDATVVIWRELRDRTWNCGPVVFGRNESDGADWMFEHILDGAAGYAHFARIFFDRDVNPLAVESVLAQCPLTPEVITALNADACLPDIVRTAAAIGYPVADDLRDL
jgi:hypothetical protein